MKALKPASREKKRYLLIRGNDLKKNVEGAVKDFAGALGLAEASMNWIECEGNSGILCVNRKAVDKVRASLCVWPERIEITKVSGTLKGLRGGR